MIRPYTPISSDDDLGYVDLLIKIYFPNDRFPTGGKMTQYINNLKIGENLDFSGPKGRIIYQRKGNFLIRAEKQGQQPTRVTGLYFPTQNNNKKNSSKISVFDQNFDF